MRPLRWPRAPSFVATVVATVEAVGVGGERRSVDPPAGGAAGVGLLMPIRGSTNESKIAPDRDRSPT